MSYEDPFASPPAEGEAWEPTVVESPAVEAGEATEIVMTFKEGAGYDASWMVVHAANTADAKSVLLDPAFKELLELQKSAAAFFRGGNAKPSVGSAPAVTGAPQQAQEAPNGEERFCSHGKMQYRSGISKAGKAYKLFACTAPRQEQCPAEWPK